MACMHLREEVIRVEELGSRSPLTQRTFSRELGHQRKERNWHLRCKQTARDEPCWWQRKKQGDTPEPES